MQRSIIAVTQGILGIWTITHIVRTMSKVISFFWLQLFISRAYYYLVPQTPERIQLDPLSNPIITIRV